MESLSLLTQLAEKISTMDQNEVRQIDSKISTFILDVIDDPAAYISQPVGQRPGGAGALATSQLQCPKCKQGINVYVTR